MQHGHGVACASYKPTPYRTGYEEIIGNRVDSLFAESACGKGTVTTINKSAITITYEDGSTVGYQLGIKHGTVSGVTIPHAIITSLKVGDTVKANDIVTYNKGFFIPSELNPSAVVYKAGVLSRVALLESVDTIEDGCVVSNELAKDLETPTTKFHAVAVDFDTIIHNLLPIGTEVTPETILCTLENSVSDFSGLKNEEAINALSRISALTPKAKMYGTITNIEVLYYGEVAEMHSSLQEIVLEYDGRRNKKVKLLKTDSARTGKIDETIHVGNKTVKSKQVLIKIYIDGMIAMGTGDKVVFGNQLKSTCSKINTIPTLSEDGKVVDARFGYQSISDRIVLSQEISGLANTVLMEISKQMGSYYVG